jgi:hypothetical protein
MGVILFGTVGLEGRPWPTKHMRSITVGMKHTGDSRTSAKESALGALRGNGSARLSRSVHVKLSEGMTASTYSSVAHA